MSSAPHDRSSDTASPRRRAIRRRYPALPARIRWWHVGALLLALLAASTVLRAQAIAAPLWADEGISEGIASHSLGGVLDALRQDGSPPLYYLLLHGWIRAFGDSEAALHALSLVFALAFVPAALWAGWRLFGPGAGLAAATLAAVNPYLTRYAQEARMYTLLSLLGIVAAAAFVVAFVHRDRRALAVFGVTLSLMAYTHNWGLFFGAAAAVVLLVLARRAPEPRALLKDGALAFGVAALLYLPWAPTLIAQAMDTGAPWAAPPDVVAPLQLGDGLFGGAGPAVAVLVGAAVGLAALFREPDRRAGRAALVLLALAFGTLVIAWTASQISPAWAARYQGAILGALVLVAGVGLARGGRVGVAALVIAVALSVPVPSPTALANKSNADVVAAELRARLRPGDSVISTQPEQVPLLRYYLPRALRYADPRGPVADPRVMDWRQALDDLRAARPSPTLAAVLRRVPPGGYLLFVAPVTEDRRDWRAPWTELVRRRTAQWGVLLERRPDLRPIQVAPRFYRAALTVGLRAVLYRRDSGEA